MHRSIPTCLLGLLLALPAAAQTGGGCSCGAESGAQLTVSGEGEVRAAPDEALVRLGVLAEAATAREAQERASAIAQKILAGVEALGVEASQIQTTDLQLSPVYGQQRPGQEPGEPRITGYQASNVVAVRLSKLERVGPVVDAGIQAGANQVQGIDFRLKNDLAARRQALRQAVAEARAKAEEIAAALGVTLGEVAEAAEGGASSPMPRFAARGLAAVGFASQATPISPGELTVGASVTLSYRIEPR